MPKARLKINPHLKNNGLTMQETRKLILAILRERGEATVDEIVHDIEVQRGAITSVTVRHHLTKLQNDGLIEMLQMRHRSAPGRPQHIYALTEQGSSFFPNNYQHLSETLLRQLEKNFSSEQVNVILEGVADDMAREALIPHGSMPERLNAVIDFLNEHGYQATWEKHAQGFVLITHNCPYHHLAQENDRLCQIDMRLVAKMLGIIPRLLSRVSAGDEQCAYLIPMKDELH